MPFDNFYKAADQYSHRLRWCLIAAVLFIAAYFTVPFFLMWLFESSPSPPGAFKLAGNSPKMGDAVAICDSLPRPERFSMIDFTEQKTNNGSAQVSYLYKSERDADEVMPQFLIWFDAEGWQRVFDEGYGYEDVPDRAINFRSGNRRVSVLFFDFRKRDFNPPGKAQYEIICTVEKLQPRD